MMILAIYNSISITVSQENAFCFLFFLTFSLLQFRFWTSSPMGSDVFICIRLILQRYFMVYNFNSMFGIDRYSVYTTGTCGQDPMLPPPPPPPPFFFFYKHRLFFSYKQHFATFYVSLYDIYTINTIKQ